MGDGDSFKVEAWQRSFSEVRSMAYARANQLGRPRQYVVSRDEYGNAVVTRNMTRGRLPKRSRLVEYGDARMVLTEYPGVDLDALPVHFLEPGQTYRHDCHRIHPVGEHPWFVVQLPDRRIGFTQDGDGFTVERVRDDDTFQTFAERKLLLS